MSEIKISNLSIRLSQSERENFLMLSAIEKKPVSTIVKNLVLRELNSKKLTASQLRRLPKDLRIKYLQKMSEDAVPLYNKYKDELYIEETGDGIE